MKEPTNPPWDYIVSKTLIHIETSMSNPGGAGRAICSMPKTLEGDANHIVACVNALHAAGITNPEALPDLMRNYKRMLRIIETIYPVMTYSDILKDDQLIEATGLNPWCVNEGLASSYEVYDFSALIGDWKRTLNQATEVKEQST